MADTMRSSSYLTTNIATGSAANVTAQKIRDLVVSSIIVKDYSVVANMILIGSAADTFTGVTFAANKFPARASTGALVAKDISDDALAFLAAANYSAMRTALGVAIGTNVQAYDADLTTWAGITPGTGIGTWLATPSSANLIAAITDETGTGALVFANSPTLVTPAVGTASQGDNSTRAASTAYVDAAVAAAVAGLLDLKTATDCSGNPNYPAASKGDVYLVSVAGKIGGASGKSVDAGDMYIAIADNAGGTEASVGTSWVVMEHNLNGLLLASNNLSDVGSATTARTNLGIGTGDSPQFAGINLGHATDTTITRVSAGLIAVEGSNVILANALGTGVLTALGINVGSAGAVVVLNGALGTPSSGTLTSCTMKDQLGVACSDETTALTAGTAKVTFRMPFAMTVTGVRATLSTAQTSGSIFTVDINEAGTTILSTKLTIDNTEKTSQTAATAPVISDSSLADDAEITVDIDQVGDGTAKGLKIWLIGTRS